MLQSLQNSCQWVFIFYLQWYVKFFLILDSNYRSSQVETNRQASLRLSSGQGICRKNYRGEPDRLPQDGELILGQHGGGKLIFASWKMQSFLVGCEARRVLCLDFIEFM